MQAMKRLRETLHRNAFHKAVDYDQALDAYARAVELIQSLATERDEGHAAGEGDG